MLCATVVAQVKGCEIPGCEAEDGSVRLVAMDDLLLEPDARALMLCEVHFEKWNLARQEAVVATPAGPVLYCQSCKVGIGPLDATSLADWMTHQYGMGSVVGWLCPRCRQISDEAN